MATRGRPREGKKLRKPSDYPTWSFRVPEADFEALGKLLERVRALMEKQRRVGDPPVTAGRVLTLAVATGLEALAEKLSKK